MYKRVVLKLSGEALAGSSSDNFDDFVIDEIIKQVKDILEKNIQVSIVVGGGNFWRGRSAKSNMDRTKADQIGMLATVMNAIYLSDSFMTPFSVGAMKEVFSK